MENSVKARLLEFIESQNLSVRKFEVKCGFPNAYVSNMKRSIMPDRMKVITETFPMLNVSWLMTGVGDMLLSTQTADQQASEPSMAKLEGGLARLGEQAIGSMERLVSYHSDISRRYQEYLERVMEMQNQTFTALECERANVAKLLDQLERMQQQNERVQQQNEKLIDMLRDVIGSKRV